MLKDKLSKGAERGQTNMLSNKRGHPRKTNVGLGCPQFHEIGVWMTHRLMHEHVSKRANMQRSKESQMGGTKQARQASHRTKWRKGMHQANQHHRGVSHKWSHPNKSQEGRMQPHKQVALKTYKHKPTEGTKYGKAQIQTGKHGDKTQKQASIDIYKGNDPNPLIKAQVYGCRPKPQDLDLHPT